MLRILVLLLVLANGAYFAWANGLLGVYGYAPAQQSEPQRMAQQIHPEAVQVLSPAEFKLVEAQVQADLAPKECLQAGPLAPAQLDPLRLALEGALPAGAWQFESQQEPARWIVYMGRYASAELLARKRAELLAMGLQVEGLANAALEPGLSLGGFGTQAQADAALARLAPRGIRTARVVQERAAVQISQLKLPAVTAAMKASLADLGPVLSGMPLTACN